ncbi:phosphoglycerate dehydrogenase-like oxidoreductase [Opitutaceae bacterium TAV1]|nr:phosphoglycerate dehydrogenase-like oxidoreductase [Opitutaceae bacterium TAV1]
MNTPSRPVAVFLLNPASMDRIYGEEERADISRLAAAPPPLLTAQTWREQPEVCRSAEVIFSGWGMPCADEEFLAAFPALKAVFYGAGSVKGFVTDALWQRGIIVSSAGAANAVPVAEFAVSQIVLSAKRVWHLAAVTRARRAFPPSADRESPGMYDSTIGLISLGTIGRMVARRLQDFHVRVVACDPLIDPLEAARLDVELCSLEDVFRQADVVSCHTPWLPETEGLIQQKHFASMKPGATFINTARGAIIDESGLIAVLRERPDLWALLDVTWPIPPEPGSPLHDLPNVMLTPHIAGSMGPECRRMGRAMVEEFQRYLSGAPLGHVICREQALVMA